MRSNVHKLYEISCKDSRLIIGLMSGTSFDGLDLALCKITGSGLRSAVELLHFETVDYAPEFKERLKEVFAKKHADLETVTLLNEETGVYFAKLILKCLQKWAVEPAAIDLIASHGQTIYHAPKRLHNRATLPNGTLQIGDGDHIAVNTGIITLSDFRQKNLAAGGEGAPLAVYGDYLLFSKAGENRVMLNIGGIANFTWLPASQDPASVFSTDVGPGNTLMDQYIQRKVPGVYYDKDAALAKKGRVNEALLTLLMNNDFFNAGFPKTTGPELFSLAYLDNALKACNETEPDVNNVLATLCRFSAGVIVKAIKDCCDTANDVTVYTSGGGIHNPLLMEYISSSLPGIKFRQTSVLGINPDAKEAVLFALLANESVAGSKIHFGDRQGVPAITMGKISFPE